MRGLPLGAYEAQHHVNDGDHDEDNDEHDVDVDVVDADDAAAAAAAAAAVDCDNDDEDDNHGVGGDDDGDDLWGSLRPQEEPCAPSTSHRWQHLHGIHSPAFPQSFYRPLVEEHTLHHKKNFNTRIYVSC